MSPLLLPIVALILSLARPENARAQFYYFTRAIPQLNTNGLPMPGANTTFADGSLFQPTGNDARSDLWAWRPFGDQYILSSLGPNSSTPPAQTKELVTTVTGLESGSDYEVKALFWTSDSQLWGIRAGLKYAGGLRTNAWFTSASTGVLVASYLPWQTMPSVFTESSRTLFAAPLGVAKADTNGQIKVFVHDLPSADSSIRTWYQGVAAQKLTAPGAQAPNTVDCSLAGSPFHRGVRGLALADITIDRGEYSVGIPKSLEVARGSSIRGVATGLAAEIYDWRVRNGQARPPTLQFLRYSRDYQAELFLGVNLRGLVEPNPAGGIRYYNTNRATLAAMAADWARYVGHIVPTYRQGNSIADTRDKGIVDSLTWSSAVPGDSFDKLLAPAEASVPRVAYWEIGNEPTIGVTAYSVTNSFTLDAAEFHLRYGSVAQAIKAEDPTVKVGPTLVNGSREADQLAAIVADSSMPIDFITYHPYEKMGLLTNAAMITLHLGSIYSRQLSFLNVIKQVVADNGRNPDALEYAATEVNVSNWDTNDTDKEARMAHALGTVETVFSHARLGLVASHYWIWPTHRWDGTQYPVFKAYEKLRDHLGDTLVSYYAFQDIRVYTTRDSRTGELAVWALNFSNSTNSSVSLQLNNLPKIERATLLRLQDISGVTTLDSVNLASDMPGGPSTHVDWTTSNLTQQISTNLQLALPAATVSLLVLETGVGPLTPTVVNQSGTNWLAVTFQQVPYASAARYRLHRSNDLKTWTPVSDSTAGPYTWITLTNNVPFTAGSAPQFFRVELLRN